MKTAVCRFKNQIPLVHSTGAHVHTMLARLNFYENHCVDTVDGSSLP